MSTFLYSIESTERLDAGLALFPGIPQENLTAPGIGEISQGIRIELRTADGNCIPTIVADYCVRVPANQENMPDVSKLPITLIIPQDKTTENIRAGTEVWVGDQHRSV